MTTKTGLTAADIRHGHLYGVTLRAAGEVEDYTDQDIERKIRAAEDFWERDTGIAFGSKRIVSQGPARGLVRGTDYDLSEEAYTYPPDMFQGIQWGYLQLRHAPVISVERLAFAFPHPATAVFAIRPEWIRVDHKYGQINIIPTSGPTVLIALNSFILSTVGGGFTLPKSVLVDYTAGLPASELAGNFADVIEGIALRATLSLLPQLGIALSAGTSTSSLSMDGLSESRGFGGGKYGPYSGIIEAALMQEKELREAFTQSQRGIQLCVM